MTTKKACQSVILGFMSLSLVILFSADRNRPFASEPNYCGDLIVGKPGLCHMAKRGHVASQVEIGMTHLNHKIPNGCRRYAIWDEEKDEKKREGYLEGVGVPTSCKRYVLNKFHDFDIAYYWLSKAADAGNAVAQINAAWLLDIDSEYGEWEPGDAAKAMAWYEKAVASGRPVAMFNLAWHLMRGLEVEQDTERAIQLYERAFAQGLATAAFNLGAFYQEGKYVPKDDNKAIVWFHRAAFAGHANAQLTLAYYHKHGILVEKDAAKSKYWRQAFKATRAIERLYE